VINICKRSGKRIVRIDEEPDVIVTADGIVENGFVRPLKEEVDEALPDAKRVIVIRHLGDVPLGPTYDVYLDVQMRPGRDEWVEL
jgi:acyl-coenzyme A synthetase/AMP-(fatty) acid ligase